MCRLNFLTMKRNEIRADDANIYAKCTRNRGAYLRLASRMQLSVHERIVMKNAFNDERLDRWRGVLHAIPQETNNYRLKNINATIKIFVKNRAFTKTETTYKLIPIDRVNLCTRSNGSIVSFFRFFFLEEQI